MKGSYATCKIWDIFVNFETFIFIGKQYSQFKVNITYILNYQYIQEEEVWREYMKIEADGERIRGIMKKIASKEDQISSTRSIVNHLSVHIKSVQAYHVSDKMKKWKLSLFTWLCKLLELAQDLVKVSKKLPLQITVKIVVKVPEKIPVNLSVYISV